MTLVHQFLASAAERTPDGVALLEPRRSTSFAQLNGQANRFANLLVAAGVRRGDRVVLALENSLELVAAYFGAMKAGAVAVPLPPGPKSDRLGRAIVDCAPAACLIDGATARDGAAGAFERVPVVYVAGGAAPPARPARFVDLRDALDGSPENAPPVRVIDLDLAAIIYTSGSTGEPRGVMLTHRNFVANARSIIQYLALTPRDRVMCVLPFHYVYGLSLLHTHVAVGGSVVIDNGFAFPNVVLAAMQRHNVTGFAGVPSSFALLLHRSSIGEMEFPSLRYVTQAGGAMPPARIREWLERGPRVPFFVMYGATEAAARLTYLPPSDLRRKMGSIGRPIPNVEITVVKEDGTRAAAGEVGELVARGANIAMGYWNRPSETADKFGPDGYRTGDLGYADDEGYLFLVGRTHDMIKVGARRVGAREIEDVIYQHPSVHEAAVVAAVHDLLGEVPVAFVALRDESAGPAEALRPFCAQRLPSFKVPVRFVVLPELPKLDGAGKIDKVALRALAAKEDVTIKAS